MTDEQVEDAIEARLATWSASSLVPVYKRSQVPAEPPSTGYLSWVVEWGREEARSTGGPQVRAGSVNVVSFELYVPRGKQGDATRHGDTLKAALWHWNESDLLMIHWRRQDPEQRTGGPYFQLNFFVGIDRNEIRTVAA